MNLLRDLLSLLFPNPCNACGTDLHSGEKLICSACLYHLPFTDHHLHAENRVAKLLWGRMDLQNAMALLDFRKHGPVQHLLHNLKYRGKKELGIYMGSLMGERLKDNPLYRGIDLIVPVPLHKRRERERGYNQSTCLANGIAGVLNLPVHTELLKRVKYTESQTRKSRYGRFENMQEVFKVYMPEEAEGKHILLVDDIITTGTTLEACAAALLESAATAISMAAMAYAR